MKVLIYDNTGEGRGLDLAIRAYDADHEVRYWLPPFPTGEERPYGRGLIERVKDWKPSMDWADLIVLTWNADHVAELAEYFGRGYPIFGCNPRGAELEGDRELGMRVLKEAGVETAPYKVVSSPQEAIDLITKTRKAYAMKPWGGAADKSMTYVAKTPDDAIFTIDRWRKDGKFKGQLMLQEKIDGVEIGISGMFGPHGFCRALEEAFEYKKLMVGNLGENTGEMGTVIRHVGRSKLFDDVLEPISDHLHAINYVGDVSVNCIVTGVGKALPLEFTCRLGWPDHCIRQAVLDCDPVEWMLECFNGRDTFNVSPMIAVGVCLVHGDFPRGGDSRAKDPINTWSGYPIYGVQGTENIHWQQAMSGKVPMLEGDQVVPGTMDLTAGNYPLIVTGSGLTVRQAANRAYKTAKGLSIPSNLMYRTDIGESLKEDLPKIQKHGFAKGMQYG